MPFAQYSSRRTQSRWVSPASLQTSDSDRIQRSIENAIRRIEDAGFTVEEADRRNWFERLTNLPERQNVFFDTLELLSRPGQAVMGAITASREGRNPLEAAVRGFTGHERFRGSDLVEDLGVENKYARAILGTGAEILTDPLTYIPGGVLASGIRAAGRTATTPVRAAYHLAERASPGLRRFREETVQPLAERTRDALGRAFVPNYKLDETLYGTKDDTIQRALQETENRIRFMTEESAKRIADAAKLAGGIEKGTEVGRLMERDLKQFETLPLTDAQKQQIKEIEDEISSLLPQSKELNQEIKDLVKYHYSQVAIEAQSPLLKSIKEVTGGRMIKTSDMEEIKKLPPWIKRKDGMPADEIANELGYQYVDDFLQDVKAAIQQKPRVRDLRSIVKQRLEEDEYYQGLLRNQAELKSAISTLSAARREIQPEVREIPRPVREYSNDPRVQQAARNLMRSNQELRQWALDNGIQINELQGYMTHVLAAEERKRRQKFLPIDRGNFGPGQPNKSILKERQIPGSVEDINERLGRTFFEPNAFFATAIGQKRLIEYVNAVNFRRQVLSNPNFAVKYEKGMPIPENAVVIDTNNYKFIKEADDVLGQIGLADEIGGQYLVTKSVKQALDRYKRLTTDEGINGFLKAFDTAQSVWKRMALFSLPYHLRNDIGAKFNNWIGGMSLADLVKYSAQADREVFNAIIRGRESKLYREYREQGLGSSALSQVEFARAGEDVEKAVQRTIEKRSKDVKGQVKQRLNPLNAFETSREFADFIDQTNRFALYKWARDKGMTPEQAAQKVREVQFDYTKLTPFEREILTRMIPFYRWMRNNLPFQIRQFIQDPRKYANINKLRLNLQDVMGIDEENVPDWMKEQFALPVRGEGGSGQFLALNLPLSDITRATSPLKTLVDATTPFAKLPAEVALNRNFFYNRPIQEFEGQQTQFQIPGTNVQFGMDPTTAYVLQQLTGQIGRGLSGYLQTPESENQDVKFRTPSLGISSVLKDFDAERAQYYQQLDRLRRLQDLIDYIEQQTGQRPRTIAEINRGS